MTADEFRALALALPDTEEKAHHGHPDFRVKGRIFATLGPGEAWGMVKLALDDQARYAQSSPDVYEPFGGAWGAGGATKVHLARAQPASVRAALKAAWENAAR